MKVHSLISFCLCVGCAAFVNNKTYAQKNTPPPAGLTVSRTMYEGDSITRVDFYPLRVYPPLTFKNRRKERAYCTRATASRGWTSIR